MRSVYVRSFYPTFRSALLTGFLACTASDMVKLFYLSSIQPYHSCFCRVGVPRKLRNIVDQHCARPDCVLHARTASNDFKTYFVERIIGRISRVPSGHEGDEDSQMDFMWLFKWME